MIFYRAIRNIIAGTHEPRLIASLSWMCHRWLNSIVIKHLCQVCANWNCENKWDYNLRRCLISFLDPWQRVKVPLKKIRDCPDFAYRSRFWCMAHFHSVVSAKGSIELRKFCAWFMSLYIIGNLLAGDVNTPSIRQSRGVLNGPWNETTCLALAALSLSN